MIQALSKKRDFHFSVSATTRNIRPNEVDGVHYQFVTADEFESLRSEGELLEWATYSGHLYGTPRRPVEEHLKAGSDVLLNIEVEGARQVKEAIPHAVTIFIMPPTIDELAQRLLARGDTTADQVERRLRIAEEEIAIATETFDHLVVNDEVERAVAEIERILGGTRGPTP